MLLKAFFTITYLYRESILELQVWASRAALCWKSGGMSSVVLLTLGMVHQDKSQMETALDDLSPGLCVQDRTETEESVPHLEDAWTPGQLEDFWTHG